MPVFPPSAPDDHPLDFHILQSSSVAVFDGDELLEATLAWFNGAGYQVVPFECASWFTAAVAHADLKRGLGFPDYYGHNLDALDDCLYDVSAGEYGLDPDTTGLVVVLRGYDDLAARLPALAAALLDIVASRARGALLFGHRMLCFVRTDENVRTFPALGGGPPTAHFRPPGFTRRLHAG